MKELNTENLFKNFQACYQSLILINILIPWILISTFGKTTQEWRYFISGDQDEENGQKLKNEENNFNIIMIFFIFIETSNLVEYGPTIWKSIVSLISGFLFYCLKIYLASLIYNEKSAHEKI